MKIATTTSDFFSYTNNSIEAIRLLSECGFKNIDYGFDMDIYKANGFFSEEYEEHLENCLKISEDNGLKYVQAHAPIGKPLSSEEDSKKLIDDTKHSIEICRYLGIKNIVVHSGYREGLSKKETLIENKKFYEPILDFAEKYEINILTENFNKMCVNDLYWIDNAQDLRELIEVVNHPLFHACWDTGHGNMIDYQQHESLKILEKHVYALHVQDNLGDKDQHFAPYFGTLNIDSLMFGLKEIGYDGYFTLEACNLPVFDCIDGACRKKFYKSKSLYNPSLELKIQFEKLLYSIAEHITTSNI